jgi:hypothetical protein
MYVYFDSNGDIKAITPDVNLTLESKFSVTILPSTDLEKFILGKANPFNYTVRKSNTPMGVSYRIVSKNFVVNQVRTDNSFLTKVEENTPDRVVSILIINDTNTKKVTVEATDFFMRLFDNDEDINNESIQDRMIRFYLTKYNNPYYLLQKFEVNTSELYQKEKLYFPYEEYYTNTSVYTKKIINGYKFREIK